MTNAYTEELFMNLKECITTSVIDLYKKNY